MQEVMGVVNLEGAMIYEAVPHFLVVLGVAVIVHLLAAGLVQSADGVLLFRCLLQCGNERVGPNSLPDTLKFF